MTPRAKRLIAELLSINPKPLNRRLIREAIEEQQNRAERCMVALELIAKGRIDDPEIFAGDVVAQEKIRY